MKTISDYIQLLESEGAVNVVSSGAIATIEKPIGSTHKRKRPETIESTSVTHLGVDPLSKVYAPETPDCVGGPTDADADEDKKRMFHLKQQSQNDQISNL